MLPLFIFVWTVPFVVVHTQLTSCRTPEGSTGDCAALKTCTPLQTLSLKARKTPEDIDYLRKSACGLTADGRPKVCCPIRWESWTTPRSRQTTAGQTSGVTIKTSTTPLATSQRELESTTPSLLAWLGGEDCPGSGGLPSRDCCGRDSSGGGNRIIGGNVTALDEYPWLVLIEYHRELVYPDRVITRVETSCGGSLVSASYVLTAAHCVSTAWAKPTNIRLGEYNTSSSPEDCVETDGGGIDCTTTLVIPIESSLVHPSYDAADPNKYNDIALFKLRTPAPYTDFIRPICLPSVDHSTSPMDPENRLIVAGWGSDGLAFSEVKKHVRLPLVPLAECRSKYGRLKRSSRLADTQICAGGVPGEDSCAGDSGGPLMLQAGDAFVLVGVVSAGPRECGTLGLPGVYTNVFMYLQWIRDHVAP